MQILWVSGSRPRCPHPHSDQGFALGEKFAVREVIRVLLWMWAYTLLGDTGLNDSSITQYWRELKSIY